MKQSITISIFVLYTILLPISCQSDLDNNIVTTLKEDENITTVSTSIIEEIIQPTIDESRFNQYLEFKKNNSLSFTHTNDIKTNTYYFQNTINEEIEAIMNIPFRIRVASSSRHGHILSTNGKGQMLIFRKEPIRNHYYGRPNRSLRKDDRFVFRPIPSIVGKSYLLYSQQENTPISVGFNPRDPDNYFLFAMNNTSGEVHAQLFTFLPAKRNGHLQWQSDILRALDSSEEWGIHYKVTEQIINDNRTGFSKYSGKASQEWRIVPDVDFELDKISFYEGYNTKVISKGSQNVLGGDINTFQNTPDPNVDIYFPLEVEESSLFIKNERINFLIGNYSKRVQLPIIINGEINTFPIQSSPEVALYSENEQKIKKTFNSLLPINLEPRTKIEAIYTYRWYDVEVDYVAHISTEYYGGRKAKINGVWKGRIWVDEKDDVYYKIRNIDTNKIIEEGYFDIRDLQKSESKSLKKIIKTKSE